MPRTLVTTLTALAGVAFALPAAADRPPHATPAQPPIVPGHDQGWGAESSPLMHPGQAVRYWTPDKQAKANAADLPEILPSQAAAAQRRRSVPAAQRLTPGGDANGYAPARRPYTDAERSRITGRLFFVNARGRGDSCSASVVRSAVELLVVTAAHCVYSAPAGAASGSWHSSFAFVPAYDGRAAGERQREPYGRWGGRRAWKPDGYTGTTGGDWNSIYDVALIEVGKKARTLQDAVGAFTPMRNQGGRHTIVTSGYPGLLGRKPYDGRDQLWCLARTRPARMLGAAHAKLETGNCHLSKGHSGGPWVLQGTNDLIGVLSAGTENSEADGFSVANTLTTDSYGAIVTKADPGGVYDALSVKVAGPARPVRRGDATTVTATVTMSGLMAAAQVPLTLTVPPGTSLGALNGAACRPAERTATCVIDAVRPGRPVTVSAQVHVARDAKPWLPISAHVTSTPLDPSQRDNTSVSSIATQR
ncbi:V8-like Glu-specific endopeptidase [Nonomuraea polychroma]|uniref:V8-like Glu-specific endopeptidase n=1 Tax=Nonomuraea polychroma TaxID=46176 RepID=A0A438M1M4_9ACTN|nr:trypsin-like serine protease [Nonomuraea polychroma]RVX39541.1 V8-like Glu-specific endopeptidase [Nonomuraea polychroma]